MPEPLSPTDALNQEVNQRMRLELGSLVEKIVVLQAQNAFLVQEVARLQALVPGEQKPESDHQERMTRAR